MVDVWGLFQGKQFLVSGENAEALDEFLKKLEPGGSVAVYTLKMYTTATADEIDEKSPSQGSINFKLTDPRPGGGSGGSVDDRLARIEGMLSGETDDDDDDDHGDDPENSISGIILGYLKDPQKIATIIGAINDLKRGTVPQLQPGAVGTIGTPAPIQVPPNLANDSRVDRLALALDRLERADPRILEHLEKLADLAGRKADLFKLLLMQLDSGL